MIKQLTKQGNSQGINIDKALLAAAGLDDSALFNVTVNPSGGLTIQSVESTHTEIMDAAFRKIFKEKRKLFKSLADK